jgi:hypothetical protein
MNKARDLARKAADQAAEVIQQAGSDEVKVAQQVKEALQKLKAPIADQLVAARQFVEKSPESFQAADLVLQPSFGEPGPPTVVEFNPRDDRIVYEKDNLREELRAYKDKPVGTTFVFTDKPETTLFLTVVTGTDQANADTYFRNYVLYPDANQLRGQQQGVLGPAVVNPRFAAAARAADRKQAVALLKAEFNYKDENPKLDQKDQ